ncbi:MAG: MATE family efflux transporter, partial [Treponema sp.]|nr:MATE family efflux transporter [Treponema sp.]
MNCNSGMRAILKEQNPSLSRSLSCVWRLSVPVILAQITSIIMQYIDAAMVGHLGAEASASIGLVASSTWLVYGACSAITAGFSVQVAHAVGAEDLGRAKSVVQQSLATAFFFSLLIGTAAAIISGPLPRWLGSPEEIASGARDYFFVFGISQPIAMTTHLCLALMECSGNMKLPSFLSGLMCLLDVAFNALCIYVLNLGVAGAALGTALAQGTVGIFALAYVCFLSPLLNIKKAGPFKLSKECLKTAARIGLPMAFEQIALSGAQVASSRIVAPLGTVALAANSFGVTAEALCYMPGYGISSAATTLVGQSVGAERKDLARRFSFLSLALGMFVMGVSAFLMYFAAPHVFDFLTPDIAVRQLGTKV